MSDKRYQADIQKGCSLSSGGSQRGFRWPEEIPGLGPRVLAVFARCALCPPGIHIAVAGTFVEYGGRAICEACAIDEAARRTGARTVTWSGRTGHDDLPAAEAAPERA